MGSLTVAKCEDIHDQLLVASEGGTDELVDVQVSLEQINDVLVPERSCHLDQGPIALVYLHSAP